MCSGRRSAYRQTMSRSIAPRAALLALLAILTAAPAASADTVTDRQKDNPSGTLDINVAGVDPTCRPTFTITVLPQNGLRGVEPASGALPGMQIDLDANGRADRLVGQPRGRTAGVYAISSGHVGRRIAAATRTVDPGQGYYVTWQVPYASVVKRGRIRWRAVARSVSSGTVDRAPDSGFHVTRFRAICR